MSIESIRHLGFSDRKFKQVIELCDGYCANKLIPGYTLAIVRGGNAEPWMHSAGLASLEDAVPMSADRIVRLASLSKLVTAVAYHQLQAKGLCHTSDEVEKYFPQISQLQVLHRDKPDDENNKDTVIGFQPAKVKMTLQHLLTHTAGWGYDFNIPGFMRSHYTRFKLFDSESSTRDLADKLVQIPLLFEPGSAFQYGLSSDMLGYIIECISGTSLQDCLQQNLFQPLGMHDTGFYLAADKRDRLAPMYRVEQQADESALLRMPADDDVKFDTSRALYGAGGGLLSTAQDFIRLIQALVEVHASGSSAIIAEDSVQEMATNYLSPEMLPYSIGRRLQFDLEGYGYGHSVKVLTNANIKDYRVMEGEYGWAGSTNTYAWIEPRRELGVLFVTQTLPFAYHPFELELKKEIYSAFVE